MIDVESIKRIRSATSSRMLWIGRDDPIKNHNLFRKLAEVAYRDYGIKSLAIRDFRRNI